MLRFARRFAVPLCAVLLSSCTEAGPTAPATTEEIAPAHHLGFDRDDDADFAGWSELDAVARFHWQDVPWWPVSRAAFIGPDGGSLRLHDYEIVIPPGAVDRVRRFEIRLPPSGSQRRFAQVWLSPHGFAFQRPVTIRLPYRATESAGAPNIHVLWLDDGEWVRLPTTLTPDGRIETTSSHFSLYATERRGFTVAGG